MESLLQDLITLQAKAERAVASRKRRLGRQPRQPQALRTWREEKRRIAVAEEDLGESAVNREQIEADLRFYKGHLGRKRAESLYDEKELRELANGEAIVTCDWCGSPPTFLAFARTRPHRTATPSAPSADWARGMPGR